MLSNITNASNFIPSGMNLSLGGFGIPLSDSLGKINIGPVAMLEVGNTFSIVKGDGVKHTGIITEVNVEIGSLKIYGKLYEEPNTYIGFHLYKNGQFGGAISNLNTGQVYSLEFSDILKGYTFIYSPKHSKSQI